MIKARWKEDDTVVFFVEIRIYINLLRESERERIKNRKKYFESSPTDKTESVLGRLQ